jgi:hypothetical protein
MSILQAMWVHGTSVQIQREGYYINKTRVGWGTEISSQGENGEWFHFAIPTPVIFDGKDSILQKAFVFFQTTMAAKITEVHLYDGKKKFFEFKGLNLSGKHDDKLDSSNTFFPTPVHIKYGLGISVMVVFGKSTPTSVPTITFTASGADFIIP